ncbi:pickpocket protein 28-like [Macrosteles quadrilineatus]|uniref:pickpocket protein 28-like n=1 Tax=Macrosteles quadrilineatus TaxID=74068 RepID=UPI0023E11325|nr:pickpocket protein 28-like [Macrosteles quadrilineatus]
MPDSNTLEDRVVSLEVSFKDMQKLIRRKQLAGFEDKNIHVTLHGADFAITGLYNRKNLKEVEDDFGRKKTYTPKVEKPLPNLITFYIRRFKENLTYNVLWAFVHVLAAIASGYYIKTALDSWQSSPVVQATSNSQVHIDNLPFPALTFCWPFQFHSDYDFRGDIENCLDCENHVCTLNSDTCKYKEMRRLVLAHQMCLKYGDQNSLPPNIWSQEHVQDNFGEEEFNEYLSELVPSCDSQSLIARLGIKSAPDLIQSRCDSDVFQQFYSPQRRICITYNSLRHKDILQDDVVTTIPMANTVPNKGQLWTLDNMMEFKGSLNSTPIYGLPSYEMSPNIQLNNSENMCEFTVNELISIVMHNPNEIPLNANYGSDILVHNKINVIILITPRITLARDLEQYTPQQRGCYFVHEKKLTMFKFYTKFNCDVECYINSTISSCGCVPMLYPRPNNSVKVCIGKCEPSVQNCDCLPDCNSLKYELVTKDLPMNEEVIGNITYFGGAQLWFTENYYYTNVRYSITSAKEFLAYSLGVLGAFLGFSVTYIFFNENYFYTNVRYSITSAKEFLAYTLGVLGAFLGFSVTCVWKLTYLGVARLFQHGSVIAALLFNTYSAKLPNTNSMCHMTL